MSCGDGRLKLEGYEQDYKEVSFLNRDMDGSGGLTFAEFTLWTHDAEAKAAAQRAFAERDADKRSWAPASWFTRRPIRSSGRRNRNSAPRTQMRINASRWRNTFASRRQRRPDGACVEYWTRASETRCDPPGQERPRRRAINNGQWTCTDQSRRT